MAKTKLAAVDGEVVGNDNLENGQENEGKSKANPGKAIDIQMEDGRVVQFNSRAKMRTTITLENGTATIIADFSNGQTLSHAIALPADCTELQAKLFQFALKEKTHNQIAGVSDVADCFIAVRELFDLFAAGKWTAERKAGEGQGTSALQKAIMEVYGKTADQAYQFLKDKTHAQKMALRAHEKLAPVIQRLEAAKASTKVNVDDLLDELG